MSKISADQVKGEVQRFWNTFMDKNAESLMEFYSAESSVFSSVSPRAEPGRLAAARRQREYFQKTSVVRASTGPIEVVMIGDSGAVASYNFQFHANRVASFGGRSAEEDIKQGRATQVFKLDTDNKLRIVHEHLSSMDKG
jgi:ketosteroid isomerase-like protein